MKKIQLKNVDSMDEFASGAPAMQSSYMDGSGLFDDSGWWLESGWWEDSGDFEVKGGCEYYTAEIINESPSHYGETAISVRFILLWSSGNITMPPPIRVHFWLDNVMFNPYQSGDLGEAIINNDPLHYNISKNDIDEVYAIALSGEDHNLSVTVHYRLYYRYNPNGNGDFTNPNVIGKMEMETLPLTIPAEYFTADEEDD